MKVRKSLMVLLLPDGTANRVNARVSMSAVIDAFQAACARVTLRLDGRLANTRKFLSLRQLTA